MSNVLNTLKSDLQHAKDGADGLWEKFSVFLHAHPKTAVIIVGVAAFTLGKLL